MPNHVHLIIKIQEGAQLNKIMLGLNLSYTLYYNFKYKTVGHLWQGRFKSKIIERDSYLIECINYVEANPVRANLTRESGNYPWSGYSLRHKENNLLDEFGL